MSAHNDWSSGTKITADIYNDLLDHDGAVNAKDFYKNLSAGKIVHRVSDTELYVRDGVTGKVDSYSSTASAVQAAVDAANIVLLKNGTFNLGTTQIDATGADLYGSGTGPNGTLITYSGTDYAIKYDGTSAQQMYYKCGNFRLTLQSNDAKGLKLKNRIYYFDVRDILVSGNSNLNNIGFLIEAGPNGGVYWNRFWGLRTAACGTGIKLNGDGTNRPNCNKFFGPIIRTPVATGVGIHLAQGRDCGFISPHVEGTDAATAYKLEDNYPKLIDATCELTDAGSTVFELASGIDQPAIIAGRCNTGGTKVSNLGATNVYIRWVAGFKNWSSGSATMDAGLTTDTIAHGLAGTPNGQITFMPTWWAGEWKASGIGAANITFEVQNAPIANSTYYYSVEYKP